MRCEFWLKARASRAGAGAIRDGRVVAASEGLDRCPSDEVEASASNVQTMMKESFIIPYVSIIPERAYIKYRIEFAKGFKVTGSSAAGFISRTRRKMRSRRMSMRG